jgi:two-component system, OmpR family, sensor histidine kinase VicK
MNELIDLVSIIKSVVNDFSSLSKRRRQHENHKSHISFLCNYPRATAYGDRTRLEQVVRNLLTNALNYTTDGSITISLHKDNSSNEWVVSVKDTGAGIDPDIFPRLFTKFMTNSQGGIGLGLYISKNIIEAQGGKIWAENNKGSNGATFSFDLPVAEID